MYDKHANREKVLLIAKSLLWIGFAIALYRIKEKSDATYLDSLSFMFNIVIGASATWGVISIVGNIKEGTRKGDIKKEFKKDINNAFKSVEQDVEHKHTTFD